MKQTPNTRKLGEQAREVVASLLVSEVSDPRVRLVTITGAEVSPDRSVLLVFVSADPERYDEVLAGLESAKGRLRSMIGHALGWRVTPELKFYIDTSVDSGMTIDEALRQVPPTLVAERQAAVESPAPDVAADVATDAAGAEPDEA
ncbi:MAG: 30S ribosome-binding factor RbfA [Coriobacteriia bacterium]|nr:30S ribosome-binding factor RbfA [Coriobacteriia bacterium]